jgi:hypothetical protein
MRIYLDDQRPTPEGWVRTFTVQETIDLLQKHGDEVTHVSLDNDLGEGQPEGYKVVDWIEWQVATAGYRPPAMQIHSANVTRAAMMKAGIWQIMKMMEQRDE